MSLIDRAKNICLTPKTEWDVIAAEASPPMQLVTTYALPLILVSVIAGFVGTTLVGTTMPFVGTMRTPLVWGLVGAVYHLVMSVVALFIVAFIIDALAPTFSGQKNFNQAFKVAVYAYTPAWIAGVLRILPMLGVLVILAALYGIYLLYLGLPRLMKNPADKSAGYTAVVVITAIVVGIVVGVIGGLLMAPGMIAAGSAYSSLGRPDRHAEVQVDPNSSLGKLQEFGKRMEEAGKKMESAEKSGDPQKQAEAAMAALGSALSGGKGGEALPLEQIKGFVPDTFAGLPKTASNAERNGVAGLMVAKAEATYGNGADKRVSLEVTDTGGMAGMMGLASWVGLVGEREDDRHMERTRKEGGRIVHEEVSKQGGTNKFAIVLGDRFIVSASGHGVDLATLKSGVGSMDLGKLEGLKDYGVKKTQ